MDITAYFHEETFSVTYLVADPASKDAAVIDSLLDFDQRSGRIATDALDRVTNDLRDRELTLRWVLETHPHADHLSGAGVLKERLGGKLAIGQGITQVQEHWAKVYGLGADFPIDGRQFDRLLAEGDRLPLGGLEIRVLETPGHTPACVTYLIGDAAFVGDVIFMPDFGTARADFPGGNAQTLYRSIRRLLDLPEKTRIFVGHDYGPGGRDFAWETTVGTQRRENIQVRDGLDSVSFAAAREARDRELDLPTLLLPALQVNIRAGALPQPEGNGTAYLKIPLNRF